MIATNYIVGDKVRYISPDILLECIGIIKSISEDIIPEIRLYSMEGNFSEYKNYIFHSKSEADLHGYQSYIIELIEAASFPKIQEEKEEKETLKVSSSKELNSYDQIIRKIDKFEYFDNVFSFIQFNTQYH